MKRADEIIVFDSSGTGRQDVAAAAAVYQAEVQERRACLSKERFPEGAPGYD